MTKIINFSDIVEANGRTIRENNMDKFHNVPIDTLVEVKFTKYHGNGAFSKIHARMFVIGHGRDCDGTPLYTLATASTARMAADGFYYNDQRPTPMHRALYGIEHGFSEEQLLPIDERNQDVD